MIGTACTQTLTVILLLNRNEAKAGRARKRSKWLGKETQENGQMRMVMITTGKDGMKLARGEEGTKLPRGEDGTKLARGKDGTKLRG